MKRSTERILEELLERYPVLMECEQEITKSYGLLEDCYRQGGKALLCGNGGSAADADHIVGELMKGFLLRRPVCQQIREKLCDCCEDASYYVDHLQSALPAISLVQHSALMSAFSNDVSPDLVFAQQVFGYGKAGDVLVGLSTSGNSKNVIHAVQVARAMGLKTIGLTGGNGGKMTALCDATVKAPETETFKIQELHLPIYHALCAMLEEEFFGELVES